MEELQPLYYHPLYQVLICCYQVRVQQEIPQHLQHAHPQLTLEAQHHIIQYTKALPHILHTPDNTRQLAIPQAPVAAIPQLAPPQKDGLQCLQCPYISRQRQKIQAHCRQQHQWTNPQARGRRSSTSPAPAPDPWRSGVWCQRFAKGGVLNRWFAVLPPPTPAAATCPPTPTALAQEQEQVRRLLQAQQARFDQHAQTAVQEASQKEEPNPWLHRTGWARHLRGLDRARLLASLESAGDDEPATQAVCQSTLRVLEAARAQCLAMDAGHAALFEVQRKHAATKPSRPFEPRMEDDTWARYTGVVRKVVRFVVRTRDWADADRPPYQLTGEQGKLLHQLHMWAAADPCPVAADRFDRHCLDLLVSLLAHPLRDGPYENALVSGLAVLGLRADGGWQEALDYTPVYAAVIKMARMLVLHQAYVEQREEIAAKTFQYGAKKAREMARGVFSIVRAKVRQFMVVVGERNGATPMDWLFETLVYGKKIRYNTVSPGQIDWRGSQLLYQKIRFTMEGLCDMLHGLVDEMRGDMAGLLLMAGQPHDAFPVIDWAQLEDDHSEDRVGYSFLADDRNAWAATGASYVSQRMLADAHQRAQWLRTDTDTNAQQPFRAAAVRRYSQQVEDFREKLLAIVHLTAGQPARAQELLGARFRNTAQGGTRNIFVHEGLVCVVLMYHKNMRATDQGKIIHRYLPREVGALLVWYLWLVLPFWQQVQGVIKGASETSAFLWADEIVPTPTAAAQDATEAEDAVPHATRALFRERKWTSDRMRRILQEHFQRFLGVPMTIAAWRHAAIAIARRYLQGDFGVELDTGGGDDDDDDDSGYESGGDDPRDVQAGHTSHIAGLVYGRLLQEGAFGTMRRRAAFRRVSTQWHGFFGLGLADAPVGRKRRREAFDVVREDAKRRRLQRLGQTDPEGALQQLLGTGARFRGTQKAVLQAVTSGQTPILQITGTGGGKSLSFMLPAACAPDGVTVVVVPLVALRADMHRRCAELAIDTHVWTSAGPNRAAAIVFVTPESAVTKGFAAFVNRLQARQQLDRVVVDECHMLLDSGEGFRRRMQDLGPVLRDLGVQLVFLTATLGPQDEAAFRALLATGPRLAVFRSPTTRRNIQYRVQTVAHGRSVDQAVVAEVTRLLGARAAGKIIVYVQQIAQAQALADALGCAVFYSSVDTAEGKAQRLAQWRATGRAIVATNAMGAGIDIPDIRAVVHAGAPRRLRDYAQESGRGGRDGQPSEATIICSEQAVRAQSGQAARSGQEETEMVAFLAGATCRRVVLDRSLDGRLDRTGCEEGEAACDVCTARVHAAALSSEAALAAELAAAQQAADGAVLASVPTRLSVQGQRRAAKEGGAVWTLRQQLAAWGTMCIVCRTEGREAESHTHGFRQCAARGPLWDEIASQAHFLQQEIFGRRQLAHYSGCFYCGVPQAWCSSWEGDGDDGGRFRLLRRQCQWAGVLVDGLGGMWEALGDDGDQVVEEALQENGGSADELWAWLGRKRRWGGVETNNLCWMFYLLAKKVGIL